MATTLSRVVRVSISIIASGLAIAGFGTPLILSHNASWPERTRTYTNMSEVAVDWGTSTPEYKAASKMLTQERRPAKIKIGRAANKPTQRFEYRLLVVAASTEYAILFGGIKYTYTSLAMGSTNDTIVAGLVAAVSAAATAAGFTATAAGAAGSQYVQILGNAAGNWSSAGVPNRTYVSLKQTHADPGIAADLSAIEALDTDWYALYTLYNSPAIITAAATWVESRNRFYMPDTSDTEVATVVFGSATDIGRVTYDAQWRSSAVFWHYDGEQMAGAALLGVCLPFTPGQETWAYKTLVGVTPSELNPTEVTNLKAKRANWYEYLVNLGKTFWGTVPNNDVVYIDVIRIRDWTVARVQEAVASLIASTPTKIPFTQQGIDMVQAAIKAVLFQGTRNGAFTEEHSVTVPKIQDITGPDKLARILRGCSFKAVLAGAIHEVEIEGTLTQ